MTARRCVNVVLTVLMTGCLASCTGNNARVESAAAIPSAPPALQTLGDRAEEIILAAAADNWPQLYACVKDVCEAWQTFKYPTVVSVSYRRPPAPVLQGPLDAAVARLRGAADRGQAREMMQAAQDVSTATVELFAFYPPAMRSDLRRLRLLESQILLNVARDEDTAPQTLEELRILWRHVRRAVQAQFGKDATAAFDATLKAQRTALKKHDRLTLATQARSALDLFKSLEQPPAATPGAGVPSTPDPLALDPKP